MFPMFLPHSGTSPRTRGKHALGLLGFDGIRNIPAHAGKTLSGVVMIRVDAEHPRARGENLRRVCVFLMK